MQEESHEIFSIPFGSRGHTLELQQLGLPINSENSVSSDQIETIFNQQPTPEQIHIQEILTRDLASEVKTRILTFGSSVQTFLEYAAVNPAAKPILIKKIIDNFVSLDQLSTAVLAIIPVLERRVTGPDGWQDHFPTLQTYVKHMGEILQTPVSEADSSPQVLDSEEINSRLNTIAQKYSAFAKLVKEK